MKTESMAEFLARGGVITVCPTKVKKRKVRRVVEEAKLEDLDYSLLPMNLKIRFGFRDGQQE